MNPSRRRALVAAAGIAALACLAPVAGAQEPATSPTAPAVPVPGGPLDPVAARVALLDAAAGWRGVLEAHRAPVRPRPGDTEDLILILSEPAAAAAPAGAARAAAANAALEQQERMLPVLADLGVTVLGRTRVVGNTIAVRVPTGRAEAVARLADVRQVVPVGFLAPAAAPGSTATEGTPADTGSTAAAAATRGGAAGPAAVRIALIDAGVDATHPALGGGMGSTFPLLGGDDLIDGDGDPRIGSAQVLTEAHGTQMAGLVLGSDAFAGLAPAQRPRLVVYRVAGAEPAGGRMRPLARTDRVLGAIERAVDPDGDGDPSDRAEVILMGLAGGFAGGGVDPVADAAEAAHDLGSTVVVPAGNDGPTLARPGTLGALAAAPSVITVGGLAGEGSPRTARLDARIGAAAAALTSLPLMGPAPADRAPMPAVVVDDEGGLRTGDLAAQYLDAQGRSRVRGALAVVARGGGTIEEKARAAAAAGARALAVWDDAGPATFPTSAGDLGLPIPVVGLGRVQGEALERLLTDRPDVVLDLTETQGASTPAGIASFSSWGPTADGRQKPELVAPAVAVPAPLPGRAGDGAARQGTLTGTSAAAAEVAARAARLRTDRPGLGADGVRSLLVQGALPVDGVSTTAQGAGLAGPPADTPVAVAPAIVQAAGGPGARGTRVRFTVIDISGRRDRYRFTLRGEDGAERELGSRRTIAAGGRVRVEVTLPGQPTAGTVLVRRDGTTEVVATAPVTVATPSRGLPDALGVPTVRTGAGHAQVMVRIGSVRRERGQVRVGILHSLRVQLVPAAGGEPIDVRGTKQDGDWPAGTYRFIIGARDADGLEIPAGVYRVRVIAAGIGGITYRQESARFSLG